MLILTCSSRHPVWRRHCCPSVPAATLHLHPATAPQHQCSCSFPHHGVTHPVHWHGQQQDNTFMGLTGKERRMRLVLPAYVSQPAGWPFNQWAKNLTQRIYFVIIRKCISLKTKQKQQNQHKTKTNKKNPNKKQRLSLGSLKIHDCKQMSGEE